MDLLYGLHLWFGIALELKNSVLLLHSEPYACLCRIDGLSLVTIEE